MESTEKKKLGVFGLTIISINTILGLKNIPFAATVGPSAILFWILAALLFFIPISLIVAELSTTYPQQGGVSAWVNRAFGKKASFLSSWFYWIANFTYYPSLLLGITVNIAYAINQQQIIQNTWLTTMISLTIFWVITLLTLRGTQMSEKLAALGTPLGVVVPVILIFGFGFASILSGHHSATEFTARTVTPNNVSLDTVMFLSTLMFAFAGMETLGTIAGDVKNPQKTFPKAIWISSVIIGAIYILGTIAFQFVIHIKPDQTATALYLFADQITKQFHLPFQLSQILGICFVVSTVGALSFLILNPSVMFYESGKTVLPRVLTKTNKQDMPANLILWQAAGVSIILLLSGFVPTVSKALNMLVLMATLAFFIPYIFLICAYIKLRRTDHATVRPFQVKNNKLAYLMASIGLISVIGTIVLTLIPAPDTTVSQYAPLVVGPIFFTILGVWFYRIGTKEKKVTLEKVS
ncbi:Glutamate/gamma-aminobutyrate antiporter [Parageobacillus caldoxylosilyticus]|jgi:glutamate:GABA antiporter|uniref:APC family permease n=1 Tax=Saccharococcus caldoxylosilyticus TaxID=81408 RepID=UPI001C4E08E9|nr:amino acid permease [Parageobacillus caldoxylosilyticus]QXJ40053.1 Glutamate/gamma-aminobutyrate antiporter [Parageobacillus caldoxylosilyticus]